MVSLSHKTEIVRDLARELTPAQINSLFDIGGFDLLLAIDKAILGIRASLEVKYGTKNLDFYREPIDGTWGMTSRTDFPNQAQMLNDREE